MNLNHPWGGRSPSTRQNLLVVITVLFTGLQSALSQGLSPSETLYPVMHFSAEEIVRMQAVHRNAPQLTAPPVTNSFGGSFGGSQSLLSRLPYVPAERQQGTCGDCWQWASTGIMEIAHSVQDGIFDRLSVQFINSCNTAKNCCDGGWIDQFAAFYAAKGYAIPWTNANAAFISGADGACGLAPCASIGTTPQYPIGSIQAVTIPTAGVGQAQAIANLKNALNQSKGVELGFFLPDTAAWNEFDTWFANEPESALWRNYHCGATYGTGGGGHAVLCVGYNDDDPANSYWIMVNSWGVTAGRPNGIFHVAMDLDYDCTLQSPNGMIQSLEWATLNVQFSAAVPHFDHFGWNTIGSPQSLNSPIAATVSAQTPDGVVDTNFTGTVSFRGFSGGGTSANLWAEGFENGNLNEWTFRSLFDYLYIAITTNAAAEGNASLYLNGGLSTPCDGLSHTLSNITPSRINFYVGTSATNSAAAYFTVGNNDYGSNSVAFFTMGRDGTMGLYDGSQWHGNRYYANKWYKVSLVLDWTAKTIDYYVDDSLVENKIPFRNPAINSLTLLNVYNYDWAEAWYDQIEFIRTGAGPVPLSPATSGAFVNGVWNGSFTVAQAVTNLVLEADDNFGHTGLSNPFDVATSAQPTIAVTPASLDFGLLQVGTTSEKTLYVSNTGGGTLTGSASVALPFRISSGASYSLGANQGHAVVVAYSPATLGTNNALVSFTGGGGATVAVAGEAYSVPFAPQYSFTNNALITINDAAPSGSAGPATPYPSTITVAGISGILTNVTATLYGFTHTYPHDVGVLLVGPKGQKIGLMANSCGWAVANLNLTFDDNAATGLSEYPAAPMVSGSYKPSNCGSGDTAFPSGAPAGPYATALGICNGSSPTGVWSLYVQDDSYEDSGYIGNGWVLTFDLLTQQAPPVITSQPLPQTVMAGSPAAFSVIASSAQTYTWRLNATNVVGDPRASGYDTPNLVISNTLPSDSGSQLSCVVGNSAGSVVSANALLTVYPFGTPWFSKFAQLTNGQFQWTLSGAPMSNYIISVSSDLKGWKTLTTVTTTNGSATGFDPNPGLKQRFYRAVLVP